MIKMVKNIEYNDSCILHIKKLNQQEREMFLFDYSETNSITYPEYDNPVITTEGPDIYFVECAKEKQP